MGALTWSRHIKFQASLHPHVEFCLNIDKMRMGLNSPFNETLNISTAMEYKQDVPGEVDSAQRWELVKMEEMRRVLHSSA